MRYNTKNKSNVRDYMKENADRHMSIEEIYEGLKASSRSIPLPSLYRVMDDLIDHGEVRRYVVDHSAAACFQYAGEGAHDHFHLVCSKCGKLIHLDCHEVIHLVEHVKEHHGFQIDMTKVNLYGLCEECQKKE